MVSYKGKHIFLKFRYVGLALVMVLGTICMYPPQITHAASSTTVDFETSTDADLFNAAANEDAPFTLVSGGLNGGDAVNANTSGTGGASMWTIKNAETLSDGEGYFVAGYFHNYDNNGYGGIGVSDVGTNNLNDDGLPITDRGMGVIFHGGGGNFTGLGTAGQSMTWDGGDLTDGWWYMSLEIDKVNYATFDLTFKITNTDATGALGSVKTEHTIHNVSDIFLGQSPAGHGYFGASGARFDLIDNFTFGTVEVAPESTPPAADSAELTSVEDGSGIEISETGCTAILSSSSVKESSLEVQDPAYAYPVGLVNYTMTGCDLGVATVVLKFHGDYDVNKLVVRKFNAANNSFTTLTGGYEDMSIAQTSSTEITLTLNINDGGTLDQDGVANGTIIDPIGFGQVALVAPHTGFGSSAN